MGGAYARNIHSVINSTGGILVKQSSIDCLLLQFATAPTSSPEFTTGHYADNHSMR